MQWLNAGLKRGMVWLITYKTTHLPGLFLISFGPESNISTTMIFYAENHSIVCILIFDLRLSHWPNFINEMMVLHTAFRPQRGHPLVLQQRPHRLEMTLLNCYCYVGSSQPRTQDVSAFETNVKNNQDLTHSKTVSSFFTIRSRMGPNKNFWRACPVLLSNLSSFQNGILQHPTSNPRLV
jgi:hypothetical protein